jgi:hypothetical protein
VAAGGVVSFLGPAGVLLRPLLAVAGAAGLAAGGFLFLPGAAFGLAGILGVAAGLVALTAKLVGEEAAGAGQAERYEDEDGAQDTAGRDGGRMSHQARTPDRTRARTMRSW